MKGRKKKKTNIRNIQPLEGHVSVWLTAAGRQSPSRGAGEKVVVCCVADKPRARGVLVYVMFAGWHTRIMFNVPQLTS